jgi:hypothetical protein
MLHFTARRACRKVFRLIRLDTTIASVSGSPIGTHSNRITLFVKCSVEVLDVSLNDFLKHCLKSAHCLSSPYSCTTNVPGPRHDANEIRLCTPLPAKEHCFSEAYLRYTEQLNFA